MPFAPRFERKRSSVEVCGKNVSTSRIGIDEATHTSARRRAAPRPAPRRPSARTGRASPRAPAGTSASAASHESIHSGGVGGRRLSSAAASSSQVASGAVATSRSARAGGLVPGRVRIDHDLARLRQPGAQRLGGGRVADAAARGRGAWSLREARAAQQHVVVGDHVRAVVRPAAHARRWDPRAAASPWRRPAARPTRATS